MEPEMSYKKGILCSGLITILHTNNELCTGNKAGN